MIFESEKWVFESKKEVFEFVKRDFEFEKWVFKFEKGDFESMTKSHGFKSRDKAFFIEFLRYAWI